VRTHHPARLRGFDYTGFHRYFLTFCTDHRRAWFTEASTVTLVLQQFLRAATEDHVALVAYCFMPDHAHLLVQGETPDADAKRFIVHAKQFSGYTFARLRGERLWQRYAYERVLRDSDATMSVARYILENPVRAGLVSSPDQYAFLGSPRYSLVQVLDAVAWVPGKDGGSG
jgi:putative transposase